jgi:hypothetical protein
MSIRDWKPFVGSWHVFANSLPPRTAAAKLAFGLQSRASDYVSSYGKFFSDDKSMGLTLEFYIGDPAVIGRAVMDGDFDTLDDPRVVHARADLSLHIQPKDIDTLSSEAAGLLQREPVLLRESLGDAIGGDERDHGAFLVAPEWLSQFAALQPETLAELTRRWMATMAQQYNDPGIHVTPEAEAAVLALTNLCRRATESATPVVHAWFL